MQDGGGCRGSACERCRYVAADDGQLSGRVPPIHSDMIANLLRRAVQEIRPSNDVHGDVPSSR